MDSEVSRDPKIIWLVDDNEELRTVAIALFNDLPIYNLRCFESAVKAFKAAIEESLNPDVVLLDIEMPGMSGIDAIEHFKKLLPLSKFIILSNFDYDPYVDQAFAKGANGYLLKPFKLGEAVNAIEAVLRNEMPVSPRVMRKVAFMTGLIHPLAKDYRLTNSEIGSLRLQAKGLKKREIADKLNISIETVKAHLKSAYRKLGVHSETAAVAKVLQERLLPPESS